MPPKKRSPHSKGTDQKTVNGNVPGAGASAPDTREPDRKHDNAQEATKSHQSPKIVGPNSRPLLAGAANSGAATSPQPKAHAKAGADDTGSSAACPVKAGVIGNRIIKAVMRGEIEAPAGVKDMGGWQAAVFTPEQQARLKVDLQGNRHAAAAVASKTNELTISGEWKTARCAFSLQKYFFNVADGGVALTQPPHVVAARDSTAGDAGIVAAVELDHSPVHVPVTGQQQQQQHNPWSAPSQALNVPHDAEPAWPPHDAEPQVTCDV